MDMSNIRAKCLLSLVLIFGATLCCFSDSVDDDQDVLSSSNDESLIDRKIICISDLHLTDARSHDPTKYYADTEGNIPKLVEFLEGIAKDDKVKELVICGDMLDEWKCPPDVVAPEDRPFSSAEERFLDIASEKSNKKVIDKLKEIVNGKKIKVTYTPGNHDNLCTKEIIQKVIPGINFEKAYYPMGDVVMEHGHRYDLFNSNIKKERDKVLYGIKDDLPLGYFITRQHTVPKEVKKANLLLKNEMNDRIPEVAGDVNDGIPVVAAAYEQMQEAESDFKPALMKPSWDDLPMHIYDFVCLAFNSNIKDYEIATYRGVDPTIARDTVRKRYKETYDAWENNRIQDQDVLCSASDSLYCGTSNDYFSAVKSNYFENNRVQYIPPKVVVFGHSHVACGNEYKKGQGLLWDPVLGLYLNTGTWVDAKKPGCNYAEIDVYPDKFVGRVFSYNGKDVAPTQIFSGTVKR